MWTEFSGTPDEWDALVAGLSHCHPTHLFHWLSLSSSGVTPLRLLFLPGPGVPPLAAIQLCKKRATWGGPYFRSDGGIAGDFATLPALLAWIKTRENKKWWYLRIFHRRERCADDIVHCQAAGFKPVLTRIHTGLSAVIRLTKPYVAKYSGNWRHNFSRSMKKNLSIAYTHEPKFEDVVAIYRQLEETKGLAVQFSEDELRHLTGSFAKNLLVAEVRNEQGLLLSLRAALLVNKTAFDLFAATNELGRTSYASNLAFHGLLEKCAEQGIEFYDCAGLDPEHGKGVMQFKQGAGGVAFEYAGEWDYGSRKFIQILFNGLLMLKLLVKK